MQLQIDPLVDTNRHHALHVPRPRTESQAIERVQGTPSLGHLIAGARGQLVFVLVLLISQQRWDSTREADGKKQNDEFHAAHNHEDSGSRKDDSPLIINPDGRKSC